LEVFFIAPSDGCHVTATCLDSTQALRSQRVSSALKIADCVVAHRSDRCSSPVRPVPTGQTGQTGTHRCPSNEAYLSSPHLLVLHLHQHQSSRNLHLQYLAKNQTTQRCQSLITQGSDHPSVLEPHMVLTYQLFLSCGS
jgi:hypothetical protein